MTKNFTRLSELDGLRGIATIAVMLFHYFLHYHKLYGHSFDVPSTFRVGYYGVHLFFTISGFVIYWTLTRTQKPTDFIWSRFTRLYPVYWCAMLITFLVVALFSLPGREVDVQTLVVNFSMIQEYLGYEHVDGVYWTLSLELAFYFWILMIFIVGWMKHIQKILLAWVILAAVVTFHRFSLRIPEILTDLFLLDYIELFAAGVCFYKLKNREHSLLTILLLGATAVSVLASYPRMVALGLFSIYGIFFLISFNLAAFLRNSFLVYFGAISYSLYLIHQNVGYIIINYGYKYELPPALSITIAIAVSIILAHGLLVFVEKPGLRYLRALRAK